MGASGEGSGQFWRIAAAGVFFTLLGAAGNGGTIAQLAYLMEISPDDDRPAYSGYFNALVAPAALLPLAGDALVAVAGSSVLFAVSAIAAGLQWVLVRQLRAVEGGEAMMQRLRRALRRTIAHSWLASRLWYRLHGLRLAGRPAGGRGLVLRLRRQHARQRLPRASRHVPARVAGRPHPGLSAALQPRRPAGRQGGAGQHQPGHRSRGVGCALQAYAPRPVRLDSTEGVPGRRYRHLWLGGEDIDGRPIEAVTYIAEGKEKDGTPSLRYLTLPREGARAHGLPQHWVSFLESVRPAESWV